MAPRTLRQYPFRTYVRSICLLLLAVSLLSLVHAQQPLPRITVTDIGAFEPSGINNYGQVIGRMIHTDDNSESAILWDDGTLTTLASVWDSGRNSIAANHINDLGQVVGAAALYMGGGHTVYRSWLWHDNMSTDISVIPAGINNRGQIVGSIKVNCGEDECDYHAALWQNGSVTDLGTLGGRRSGATDINEHGQIVGSSGEHAFLWQNGAMIDLGTLGGCCSRATDINDHGQIIGWSQTATGENHPVLWQNGSVVDLGEWGAAAINNRGQIVGSIKVNCREDECDYHAFLWQNGAMFDLGTLGGCCSHVTDINDQGQLVGWSETGKETRRAALWTLQQPTPSPAEPTVTKTTPTATATATVPPKEPDLAYLPVVAR